MISRTVSNPVHVEITLPMLRTHHNTETRVSFVLCSNLEVTEVTLYL